MPLIEYFINHEGNEFERLQHRYVNNKDDVQIVKATIRMAHDLDLLVTAEGIEYSEVSTQLTKLGCDKGQGYYYTKALPLKELNNWRDKYNKD